MTLPNRRPHHTRTHAQPESSDQAELRRHLDARFRGPLMSYFSRRTGSRAEVEDLTQEVFTRILAAEVRLPPDQADGLIFTTAGNLLRDRGH